MKALLDHRKELAANAEAYTKGLDQSVRTLAHMSARCNQHIQSSMNVDELLLYGGALEVVIRKNLAVRQALFASEEWKSLIARLSKFKNPPRN
jgi:hypothetical protein